MISEELLNTIRTRPRFVYETSLSKEEFITHLKQYFESKDKIIGGYVNAELSVFRIRSTKDDYWSPQLQVRIEYDEYDKKTYIRGVFGPKPAVWTFFMFLNILFGTAALFCLMFYFASMQFSPFPILLYAGIFSLLMLVGLFVVSKVGQKQTQNQMRLLKTFILMVLKHE